MATKPGPAIALAALAALFLLKKKGGGGGGAGSGASDANGVPDGTVVDDDTPKKSGAPSSGGKKVPKGTGAGGGSWDPGKLGPKTLWISPDCQNVVMGVDYYDEVLAPAMAKVVGDFRSNQDAYLASLPENQGKQAHEYGGRSQSDLYTVLAVALGFWKLNKTPVVNEGFDWFADTEFANKPPGSCVLAAPMFHVGMADNKLYQAGIHGIVPASQAAFNEAVEQYFTDYPQLAIWLYTIQNRMVQDERFPPGGRSISSFFDLSFLVETPTGAAGTPPEEPPVLKVQDLSSPGTIEGWWNAAQAYIQKWKSQYSAVVIPYEAFISAWWDVMTSGGTKPPAAINLPPEQAAKEETPASTGILIADISRDNPNGPGLIPLGQTAVKVGSWSGTTSPEGHVEAKLPPGWHQLEVVNGPLAGSSWGFEIKAGVPLPYYFIESAANK